MDTSAVRRALVVGQFDPERYSDERADEIYREDAVLEFPQSGERFIGLANFVTWRMQYPAQVEYRIRRVTGDGDLWVNELLVSYDGGPWNFGVCIQRFRGDKVAHEVIYVMDGFEAAEGRAEWVTRFDPLASVPPGKWQEGVPFGIG